MKKQPKIRSFSVVSAFINANVRSRSWPLVTLLVVHIVLMGGFEPMHDGHARELLLVDKLPPIRKAPYGAGCAIISRLATPESTDTPLMPVMQTALGGRRLLTPLLGDGLPRIR